MATTKHIYPVTEVLNALGGKLTLQFKRSSDAPRGVTMPTITVRSKYSGYDGISAEMEKFFAMCVAGNSKVKRSWVKCNIYGGYDNNRLGYAEFRSPNYDGNFEVSVYTNDDCFVTSKSAIAKVRAAKEAAEAAARMAKAPLALKQWDAYVDFINTVVPLALAIPEVQNPERLIKIQADCIAFAAAMKLKEPSQVEFPNAANFEFSITEKNEKKYTTVKVTTVLRFTRSTWHDEVTGVNVEYSHSSERGGIDMMILETAALRLAGDLMLSIVANTQAIDTLAKELSGEYEALQKVA